MKDKTWNRITLFLWLFIAIYFGMSYALADDALGYVDDSELTEQQQVQFTAATCVCAYNWLGNEWEDQAMIREASRWRDFLIGWMDYDEASTSVFIRSVAEFLSIKVADGTIGEQDFVVATESCVSLRDIFLEHAGMTLQEWYEDK